MKMDMTGASTRQTDYRSEPYSNSNLNAHDTIADLMTRVSQLDIAASGKAAMTSPESRSTNDNAATASRDSQPTNEDTRREEHTTTNNNVTGRDVEDIEEKLATLDFNTTRDVAGAKNFNATRDVAGAKNFNTTRDVAGAKNFNVTPDVAGAKNFNVTPDVAGAKNFNTTRDVAGAKNFNVTPDVAGVKNFNITPDVAGAKNFNTTPDVAGAKNFNVTPDVAGVKNFNTTPDVAGAKNFNTTPDVAGAKNFNTTTDAAGAKNFNTTTDVAGAKNFNYTPDVAGAKNFNTTRDVAGAKNFNVTPDVAGAKNFNCTPDVAGAKNFNATRDVAGAKTFNTTPDVAGAKNFKITADVEGARDEELTREQPDDQDDSERVKDEDKASHKDEGKDTVKGLKFSGQQVGSQKAVRPEDAVNDVGDNVSGVKDTGSDVEDKVTEVRDKVEDAVVDVGKATEKVKDVTADVGKVKAKVKDAVVDVGKATEKVVDVTADVGKAKEKVVDVVVDFGKATEKVVDVTADVGKAKEKVVDVTADVGKAKEKVKDAVVDFGKATEKVEDVTADVGKATDKVKDAVLDFGKAKGKVADIEIKDEAPDKDGQVSSGGNLLPRSPMRPEHIPSRSEPYHLTSRNRNHCAGGYVVGERAFEPITQQIRANERDCFSSVNILPFNITCGTSIPSGSPAFPFVSSTSFPEDIDGFSPQDFAAEVIYKAGPYNVNEIVQLVTSVRNPEIFEKVCEDFGFRQNVLDLPSDIPQSVLDYDCEATSAAAGALPCTADNYREIPSVSSGYHSSSSPRSTSPQSPGASQERFADNCSPLDNDVEWHGTTSEFYDQPDAVFDSGLLKNLGLDAYEAGFGVGTAACDSEVYQPVSGYGEESAIATSFAPVATAALNVFASNYAHAEASFTHASQTHCGQQSNIAPNQHNVTLLQPSVSPAQTNVAPIQLNLTEPQPNVTQFRPDITLLLPTLTQLTCRTGGGVSPATSAAPLRIQPKPSLNPESASQRLLRKLDKSKKSKIWAKISTINDEDLTKGDLDGDTQLMILLLQESLSQDGCMLEYVYALVERLKLIPGELATINNQQQSVLYLAALHCPDPDSALIARYIAEAMIETRTSVDMVYNDGDTLLHSLCREGAKRFEVLRELLSLKDSAGKLYFDTDKYNDRGMTPLLEAVSCHGQADTVRSVRLLIDAGVDTTLTTSAPCRSDALRLAINTACDPALVVALLVDPRLAAACATCRYGEATPLHCAARRNDVPPERQRRVMAALMEGGARRDARDEEGKLPAELLSGERREAFKQMGNKR